MTQPMSSDPHFDGAAREVLPESMLAQPSEWDVEVCEMTSDNERLTTRPQTVREVFPHVTTQRGGIQFGGSNAAINQYGASGQLIGNWTQLGSITPERTLLFPQAMVDHLYWAVTQARENNDYDNVIRGLDILSGLTD